MRFYNETDLEGLAGDEVTALQAFLLDGYDLEAALDAVEDGAWTIYHDCESVEDMARQI